jgi:hypothetical protein
LRVKNLKIPNYSFFSKFLGAINTKKWLMGY